MAPVKAALGLLAASLSMLGSSTPNASQALPPLQASGNTLLPKVSDAKLDYYTLVPANLLTIHFANARGTGRTDARAVLRPALPAVVLDNSAYVASTECSEAWSSISVTFKDGIAAGVAASSWPQRLIVATTADTCSPANREPALYRAEDCDLDAAGLRLTCRADRVSWERVVRLEKVSYAVGTVPDAAQLGAGDVLLHDEHHWQRFLQRLKRAWGA